MQSSKYILTSLVLSIVISACETKTAEDNTLVQNTTMVEYDNPSVKTKVSEIKKAETVSNTISVTGYIDVPPENLASISPYYGGFVKNIFILPGQSVKKGEVLFTLQNPEYLHMQQEYLEAKEQIEYLKAEYERQKTLAAEKISSTKNYKKAESDYKVMLSRYRSLQEEVKLMGLSISNLESGQLINTISIRAIIEGSVTAVNITKGAFADAKDV
ncbi:MAG: cobalt-zinc-cadmium efflux system membrane fusion protein, partial [Cyclobacteriaceae bacterium]